MKKQRYPAETTGRTSAFQAGYFYYLLSQIGAYHPEAIHLYHFYTNINAVT